MGNSERALASIRPWTEAIIETAYNHEQQLYARWPYPLWGLARGVSPMLSVVYGAQSGGWCARLGHARLARLPPKREGTAEMGDHPWVKFRSWLH